MKIVKLEKNSPTPYSLKKNEIQAYEDEGNIMDDLAALADSVLHGGIVASDTLNFGPFQTNYTITSPVNVTSDSTGVGISLSGIIGVEVGFHINTPSTSASSEPSTGAGYNSQESLCY